MGPQISQKQIDAILALSGEKRYTHFIKLVADWEETWGLYDEGWAMFGDDDGSSFFPLWPAKEYPTLCAINEWDGYRAERISLQDLMDDLLPALTRDNIECAIFPTPRSQAVIRPASLLLADLDAELEEYDG